LKPSCFSGEIAGVKKSVANGPGSEPVRMALYFLGAAYIAFIFLGSAGSQLPRDLLPRPALHLTQIACLFPRAATFQIEYRLAAFDCVEGRFHELDTRPYFPIRPDDKEGTFHRLGHFYRRHPEVMAAFDSFMVEAHNAIVARGEIPKDGIANPIGGILLFSLRIPLPEPGEETPRYRYLSLEESEREWRKPWYQSRRQLREARCREALE